MLSALPELLLTLQESGAAQAGDQAEGGLSDLFVPMILIIGIFYVVLILPERKKQKKRDAMLSKMSKGDKVMTTSGMYATIAQIHDDTVTLQVANDVRLRFSRSSIQTVLGDETKSDDKKS